MWNLCWSQENSWEVVAPADQRYSVYENYPQSENRGLPLTGEKHDFQNWKRENRRREPKCPRDSKIFVITTTTQNVGGGPDKGWVNCAFNIVCLPPKISISEVLSENEINKQNCDGNVPKRGLRFVHPPHLVQREAANLKSIIRFRKGFLHFADVTSFFLGVSAPGFSQIPNFTMGEEVTKFIGRGGEGGVIKGHRRTTNKPLKTDGFGNGEEGRYI